MILEAQQILDAMIEAGFDLKEVHPELKRPRKAVAIQVFVPAEGAGIEGLQILSVEQTQHYWTQGNGNHSRFPVAKIDGIEGHARNQDEIKIWNKLKGKEKTELLQSWLDVGLPTAYPDPFSEKEIEVLGFRHAALAGLTDTPASRFLDLLAIIVESTPEQRKGWVECIFKQLQQTALNGAADEINIAQRLLADLLFKPKKGSATLIWNLHGQGLSDRSGASPENFDEVNRQLLQASTQKSGQDTSDGESSVACSLTGSRNDIEDDKFPDPTLPQVGKTFLFSRNKDNPSFTRYGSKSVESFPVSRSHLRQLDAALSAITSPDREGFTWMRVASEQPKKSDLLLVFCPSNIEFKLADGIGSDQRNLNEFQFEDLTRRLAIRTKGDTTDQLRGSLMVAVIRSVDKGNRKMIFRRNLDAQGLDRAAQSWSTACQNIPGRHYFLPIAKGKKAALVGPFPLNPGAIPSLTKQVYLTDGSAHGDTAGGLTFSESFNLLLGIEACDPPLASRALRVAQQRLGNLLAHFATLQYRMPSLAYKQKPDLRWTCLKAQSFFSLILHAHQRKPEQTMNSQAYQIGQLCAAFDVIHAAYCYAERGGDLPPKLIGNACFQAASRDHVSALAQVTQRIAPHLGWLERFRGETKDRVLNKVPKKSDARSMMLYALKLRKTKKDMATTLSNLQSPDPNDRDLFRAELLLGYLAGPPHDDPQDEVESNPTNTQD